MASQPVTDRPAAPALAETDSETDQIVWLDDGRAIGYRVFGDPKGTPVLALHGTPGSRFKYARSHQAAREERIALIAVDRWGYGLTTARPHGQLCDFGADMVQFADRLGLQRVAITGVSGGCPFAVAAAAALGARAVRLALVSPVGLIAERTLRPAGRYAEQARQSFRLFHTFCFKALPHMPAAIAGAFNMYRAALTAAPNLAMMVAISRSAEVDRAAMRDRATRQRLIETFAEGLRPGTQGPIADLTLFQRPWGVPFANICAQTRLWIGLADRNVPLPAVYALADALPNCELTELEGEGHLWVAFHAQDVMAWIGRCGADHRPAR